MSMYVYVIQEGDLDIVKIGVARNIEKRITALQHANHRVLTVRYVIERSDSVNARRLERNMHKRFRTQRIRGEWFGVSYREVIRAFPIGKEVDVFVPIHVRQAKVKEVYTRMSNVDRAEAWLRDHLDCMEMTTREIAEYVKCWPAEAARAKRRINR